MPTVICRHIRTNGRRCGSPALREKPYCFHHDRAHSHALSLIHKVPDNLPETVIHSMQTDRGWMQREPLTAEYYNLKPSPITLAFPPLEDRESIGVALSMVLSAMAQKRIDAKDATPLLYGLQVASANARTLNPDAKYPCITDIVTDETGLALAPDEDPEQEQEEQAPKGLLENAWYTQLKQAREQVAQLQTKLALYEPDPSSFPEAK